MTPISTLEQVELAARRAVEKVNDGAGDFGLTFAKEMYTLSTAPGYNTEAQQDDLRRLRDQQGW